MNTRYKANIALLISVCGLALSFLFAPHNFWGGVVYHAFLAAVIGGLADWFAVTALFRKPFGIGWRTDILRNNRQRIMQELVSFVSDDILNTKNIMSVVEKERLGKIFAIYLSEHGGKERILMSADSLLREMVKHVEVSSLISKLWPCLAKEFSRDVKWKPIVVPYTREFLFSEAGDKLAAVIAKFADNILQSAEIQELLKSVIVKWHKKYEQRSMGRMLLFSALNLTDEKLAGIAAGKLREQIADIENSRTELGGKVRRWLAEQSEKLISDERFEMLVDKKISDAIDSDEIQEELVAWLNGRISTVEENPEWLSFTENIISTKIDEYINDQVWQDLLDTWLKRFFDDLLAKNHTVLVELIETRLNALSDDMLIDFIEEKVADDIQIIRINGAVVGSLAGIVLYLLTFFIEEVVGL